MADTDSSLGGAGGAGDRGTTAVDPLLFVSFSDFGFPLLDMDRDVILVGLSIEFFLWALIDDGSSTVACQPTFLACVDTRCGETK